MSDEDETERKLRKALRLESDKIEPDPQGLQNVRRRIRERQAANQSKDGW